MIRPRDRQTANRLDTVLMAFSKAEHPLPGIVPLNRRQTFVAQMFESMRRIEVIELLKNSPVSVACSNPQSAAFNPIKAAIYHSQQGSREEAFWLVFLLTHFSKHHRQGWALMQAVYGNLGISPFWTWQQISTNLPAFRLWLRQNQTALQRLHFGNHRKYETVREDSDRGLANVVEAYVGWVSPPRTQDEKVREVIRGFNDPHAAFDALYNDASTLFRWGRLAKFDHLTMLKKVGLLNITPGRAYLTQATGPRRGAALLLHDNSDHQLDIKAAEAVLAKLGQHLGVGQQEVEDSLCNWQKSPDHFRPFR